ncbi:hypothetical protein ADL22_29080 [Streptomyces sp. NRRL F-4489]|uniref:hypothetical protein n=1 Tax=Streptomyces sp. NRRL F-4489 TaxID=1609095 RepID=UPI00074ABA58|nr:hypothetical protein [Streptomyces sp. NRRL F-4489]KUL34953.1 hypothetical protein ADL22_29080 [Streptomyces sp. NRRL F-4489]
MAITDDVRKALTDPTPLYALAGTADLAAEKLGEVPQLVERIRAEAPKALESVRTDPKDLQVLVTKQAKEAQEKLTELLGSLDGDLKKFRDQAQELALRGVGRAAEVVVQARETYDGLAERGRGAVQNWRGGAAEQVEELAVAIEPDPEPKGGADAKGAPASGAAETGGRARTVPANGTRPEAKATASTQPKSSGAKKPAAPRKPAAGQAKKPTPPSSAK